MDHVIDNIQIKPIVFIELIVSIAKPTQPIVVVIKSSQPIQPTVAHVQMENP
jgi:hypothetical protein